VPGDGIPSLIQFVEGDAVDQCIGWKWLCASRSTQWRMKREEKSMKVMIVGGGRTGTQLAYLLMEQKHQVHVVDHRKEVLARLHRELPTEVIYEGDATEVDVLERAGIRGVDVSRLHDF
jgi:NADH dehydrogenase FAD-containing subunit